MEILYFKDLGDTASVVEECQILIPSTNVPLGDIYPPIKLYCNVLGIGNVICHFKVIAGRQTDSLNTIHVGSQPLRGSTNKKKLTGTYS